MNGVPLRKDWVEEPQNLRQCLVVALHVCVKVLAMDLSTLLGHATLLDG